MKPREIYKAFNGKLVGSARMKRYVCEVLSLMPLEVVEHVTSKCWFIGSMEDAWAFTFTGNDLKDQHLIFLSDHLLFQSRQQVLYSIVHEIGHVVLEHRNSILERQSRTEIRKQEREADLFAKRFIV